MSEPTVDLLLNHTTALERPSTFHKRAVVIGIYGIPGCGKTFLLDQLKLGLGEDDFVFYEGSMKIATLVPGGLDAFQTLEDKEKAYWRQLAISTIRNDCNKSGQAAVVAGHFMFWPEEEETGTPVHTREDLATFTHILYLDVPPEVIEHRRINDKERTRPSTSITHLQKWQQAEKIQLRRLCRDHGILFSVVSWYPRLLDKVATLLNDFRHHTEEYNQYQAENMLDEAVVAGQGKFQTVVVMDADRTLAAEDTGSMFWKKIPNSQRPQNDDHPLKTLFNSPLGYSYIAFRQATLLYEEAADDQEFDTVCEGVASAVTMHPEFVSLLQRIAELEHIGAVIVTCGLRRVWEKVLERNGLSKTVKVIGGGRMADSFIVTAAVKAAMVSRLREVHQMYTWVFGDSPLDLEMLSKADQAIVVVGEEQTRSKTMDAALLNAIDHGGLRARQSVLPSNAPPRLDTTKLPLIQLTDHEFIDSVLCHRGRHSGIQILHATDTNATKLLMSPMRDAKVAGPLLRAAHHRVGSYLATEYLVKVIGLEEYSIPHVQGHHTSGYRLLNESQTSIVALMRGGEAMAFGVNEAFPLAMFIHARSPDDIKTHHLQGQRTVLLVDSVVNSGKTVIQFVQHVRNLHATIRIVVITGVAQTQSIDKISRALAGNGTLSLVALRLSDNKFTGRGTTDTGNRLFNTTHLL